MLNSRRIFNSTWIFVLVCSTFLSSCAIFDSHKSHLSYEDYTWDKVKQIALTSEGVSLVGARWMLLDQKYFSLRDKKLGYQDELSLKFQESQNPYLLIALQMKPGSLYTKSDFGLYFDGVDTKAEGIEVANSLELRSLYGFAYPFYRVFLYKTPLSENKHLKFSIRTPWGTLMDELKP